MKLLELLSCYKHIICTLYVLLFENRLFEDMCVWIYKVFIITGIKLSVYKGNVYHWKQKMLPLKSN